jgi:hypothetical protein
MVRRLRAGILLRDGQGRRVFTTALTPDACTIFVVCRLADLLEMLIPVGFSASHSTDVGCGALSVSAGLRLQLIHERSRFVCHLQ